MFFRCRKTRRSGTCRTTVTFEVSWWQVVVTGRMMRRMIIIMMMVTIIVIVRRWWWRRRSLWVMIMTVVVVVIVPMVLVPGIPQRYNRWTKGWWWSFLMLLLLLWRGLVFAVRSIIVVVMMTTWSIQRRGWTIVVVVVAISVTLNWFYIVVSSNRLVGFPTSSTSFQILLTDNGGIWDRGSRRRQWLIRGNGRTVNINGKRHIYWWGLLSLLLLLKSILFSCWW